ncbi:hypothetical protein KEM48_014194 [Puccinia striiformis f. sp. tritici PST-130]|nr:hypothetical protein H4Q26_015736 [Puccinia striiformis f. sp. tritici PST-130]KAI9630266.1 hypothetical protein KEM48_014194 [Puccinia striiformis f. sp. tritici PST-130]
MFASLPNHSGFGTDHFDIEIVAVLAEITGPENREPQSNLGVLALNLLPRPALISGMMKTLRESPVIIPLKS